MLYLLEHLTFWPLTSSFKLTMLWTTGPRKTNSFLPKWSPFEKGDKNFQLRPLPFEVHPLILRWIWLFFLTKSLFFPEWSTTEKGENPYLRILSLWGASTHPKLDTVAFLHEGLFQLRRTNNKLVQVITASVERPLLNMINFLSEITRFIRTLNKHGLLLSLILAGIYHLTL